MKLALVISSLAAGGAERVLCTLANSFAERGHKVTMLTDASMALDHYRLSARVQRITFDLQSDSAGIQDKVLRNLSRIKRLRSALLTTAPDAVLAFGDTVNTRTVLSCLGTGIPVVVSERTDPRQHVLPWPWRLLRLLLYPFAARVVVQTEPVAQWARGVVPSRRVHVIPNPVRPLPPLAPRPSILGGRRFVIAVGRLGVEKGFDMLLRAFARADLSQFEWQLVILGEGPERLTLQGQIDSLGLRDCVLMPGAVLEPQQWLQHADFFVLSSRFEGFPNALLEAMQCGLSAVAFSCPSGPGEIIQHEHTGLLVPPGDIDALAGAICRLGIDPHLRHRLGAAGAQDVARRFNLDRISALWEDLLSSVMSKPHKGGPQ